MKIQKILIAAFWFFCFVAGIAGVLLYRYEKVKMKRASAPVFSPQVSAFAAVPPVDAMTANILSLSGDVQLASRDQNGLQEIGVATGSVSGTLTSPPSSLVAGEEIITGKDGGIIIEYPGFAKITVGKNADISLSNPLPKTFLIAQKAGVVSYQLESSSSPLSVRIDGALIELDSGNHVVTISDSHANQPAFTSVETVDGTAQIGMVNKQNATQTWTVTAGQTAKILAKDQTVEIKDSAK